MSSWHKSQSTVKPLEYDNVSSQVYVYLRKNIIQVTDEETKEVHYEYDELKLPIEVEELIVRSNTQSSQINSLEDAICDLMIGTEV